MKYVELKDKSKEELTSMVAELRDTLYGLRRKRFMGQLSDVRDIRSIRKDIARLLTAIAQKNS